MTQMESALPETPKTNVAIDAGRAADVYRFFAYGHLPAHLQAISKPIGDLATEMIASLPDCAERTAGLRKLLEAKDCFVRAKV